MEGTMVRRFDCAVLRLFVLSPFVTPRRTLFWSRCQGCVGVWVWKV